MSVNVRSGDRAFDSRARLCLAVETDRTPLKLAMDASMTSGGSSCESTDEQRDLRCLRYRMSVILASLRQGWLSGQENRILRNVSSRFKREEKQAFAFG